MLRDLRFGLRILRRNPSYACAAIAVMALGVGASTAVFSVLRAILIEPIPYRDPARLVLFRADLPGFVHQPALTTAEYQALRERADLFDEVGAIVEADGNLTTPGDMAPLNTVAVTDGFFDTLGVRPALGRLVTRNDSGQVWSVDIGDELWRRHFKADPSILGRQIEVNGNRMIVAGVLPPGFKAYLGPDASVPRQIDLIYGQSRGYEDDPFRGQVVVARLRAGVTLARARAAVDVLAQRLVAAQPDRYRTGAVRLSLAPLEDEIVSVVKPALVAVSGAVALVLLVACANLTNLLLARGTTRGKEIALRMSIGATRARIVRQLNAEAMVVGGCGAAGGLLLAQWGVAGLLLLAPAALPRREAIVVDMPVALFAVALALACALAVSLVPAWHATRRDVGEALKADPGSARNAGLTRGLLVAAQLALSLILLVGAGLLTRAFVNMRALHLGFDPRGVESMFVSLQGRVFGVGGMEAARSRRREFYERLLASTTHLPGVDAAGVGFPLPLGSALMTQRFTTDEGGREQLAEGFIALAGYLEALRVPLVAGRYFVRDDNRQPVIVVDERLASDVWPQQSAIGKRLRIVPTAGASTWAEVVGVVAHVQTQSLRSAGMPQIWMSYAVRSYAQLDMVVRAGNPPSVEGAIGRLVQQLGAGRPISDVRLLQAYVDDASADTRFALFVLGVLAALAVLLSGVGVYGVVAYATARRAREIAVRRALGADARAIVALIAREGGGWIAGGLAAGALGARVLSRFLSSLLFQVKATDVATYVAVAVLLALVAAVATALPAIRAIGVDPMRALRSE